MSHKDLYFCRFSTEFKCQRYLLKLILLSDSNLILCAEMRVIPNQKRLLEKGCWRAINLVHFLLLPPGKHSRVTIFPSQIVEIEKTATA